MDGGRRPLPASRSTLGAVITLVVEQPARNGGLARVEQKLLAGWAPRVLFATDTYHESEDELADAVRAEAPRLRRELADPRHDASGPVLLCGKYATTSPATLALKKTSAARGFVWDKGGRLFVPTISLHVAAVASHMRLVWDVDVARAGRLDGLGAPFRGEEGGPPRLVGGPSECLLGPLAKARRVSLDIETDGIDPQTCKIRCVGIGEVGKPGNVAVLFPWTDAWAPALSAFLSRCSEVVTHNGANFDWLVLANAGVTIPWHAFHDTLLLHHTFRSHLPQRLDQVVSEYCDAAPWKCQHGMRDVGEKGAVVEGMSGDELCLYNAQDARLTALAWDRMRRVGPIDEAVYQHDRRLARVCYAMQQEGIGVDVGRKEALQGEILARQETLLASLRDIAGATFAPSKPGDVRRALYGRLGLPKGKLTPKGSPSTDDEVLEGAKLHGGDLAAFAEALLDWRIADKIRSTYLDAVVVHGREVPGETRAHYNWKPFGTISGRLSCRFQSVPRWHPALPETRVREIYVPRPGCTFVYYDVSQAEMRLAAFIAADETFMKVATGSDVHAGNAKVVFPEIAKKGWLDGEAKKDPARGKPYRDIAKNLGFAIAYGAEADKVYVTLVRKGFRVSMQAVKIILAKLRTSYHTYYHFVEKNVALVRKQGYLRSPILGRARHFGIYPKPTDVSNYPVQSALADIINARTIELFEAGGPWQLVTQVHDSLTYECPNAHVEELQARIREQWAVPIPLAGGPLVLPVDLKTAHRWSSL